MTDRAAQLSPVDLPELAAQRVHRSAGKGASGLSSVLLPAPLGPITAQCPP